MDIKQMSRAEVLHAILDGRVAELWPGATFEKRTDEYGYICFQNGSRIKYDLRERNS